MTSPGARRIWIQAWLGSMPGASDALPSATCQGPEPGQSARNKLLWPLGSDAGVSPSLSVPGHQMCSLTGTCWVPLLLRAASGAEGSGLTCLPFWKRSPFQIRRLNFLKFTCAKHIANVLFFLFKKKLLEPGKMPMLLCHLKNVGYRMDSTVSSTLGKRQEVNTPGLRHPWVSPAQEHECLLFFASAFRHFIIKHCCNLPRPAPRRG